MAAIAFSQFVQTGERDTRVKLFGRKLLSTSTREGFTGKKPTSQEKIPRLVNTIMCHSLSSGEQDFDVLRLPLIRNVERGKKWKLEDVFLSIRV